MFLDHVVPANTPQCTVAAELIYRIDSYRETFFKDGLQPETMAGNKPLDMSQFARLWTCERRPGAMCDVIRQAPASDHVVVIVRREFFKVATRSSRTGARLSPAALRVQLERCSALAQASTSTTPACGVGALTGG